MNINEAIFNLLNVQFKNQLKNDEVKTIKDAGFHIGKSNGRFEVYVPNGQYAYGRYVYITAGYKTYRVVAWNGFRCKEYRFDTCEDILKKFDFEGFLRKPINKDYIYVLELGHYRYGGGTDTQRKMFRLTEAKNYIRYRAEEIARIKAQMAKLQNDLENALRYEIKYEGDLEKVRAELGLK